MVLVASLLTASTGCASRIDRDGRNMLLLCTLPCLLIYTHGRNVAEHGVITPPLPIIRKEPAP